MATKNNRAMISLPPEWEPELLQLKKEVFFNNTQAEMYRQLIRAGLDALSEKEAPNDKQASA